MKFFLCAMMALFAFTGMSALQPVQADEMAKTKLVMFHSDKCGSCKILDPKLKSAMNIVNEDKVEFIIFDFSNDDTKAKSMAMAEEKGLSGLYNSFAPKTGFAVVLSGDGQIVAELKRDNSVADIATELVTAMSASI